MFVTVLTETALIENAYIEVYLYQKEKRGREQAKTLVVSYLMSRIPGTKFVRTVCALKDLLIYLISSMLHKSDAIVATR
jgi:hypothetical protein